METYEASHECAESLLKLVVGLKFKNNTTTLVACTWAEAPRILGPCAAAHVAHAWGPGHVLEYYCSILQEITTALRFEICLCHAPSLALVHAGSSCGPQVR